MNHYRRYQVIQRTDDFIVIDTFTDRVKHTCETKEAAERMAAKLESER